MVFHRLGVLDYEFLNVMAQLSCAEPKLKESICGFLESKLDLKSDKSFNKEVKLSKDTQGALTVSIQNEVFFNDHGYGCEDLDSKFKEMEKAAKLEEAKAKTAKARAAEAKTTESKATEAKTAEAMDQNDAVKPAKASHKRDAGKAAKYKHRISTLNKGYQNKVGLTTYISDSKPQIEAWRNRKLKKAYSFVFMEPIHYEAYTKSGFVPQTAHAAFAIMPDGRKDILGVWVGEREDREFWQTVLNNLKSRGALDVHVFCTDSYGMAEAIKIVYPKSRLQRFFVHPGSSLDKRVSWEDIQQVTDDLKKVYATGTLAEAKKRLLDFSNKWREKYPTCVSSWKANLSILDSLFKYKPESRKFLYTTWTTAELTCHLRQDKEHTLLFTIVDSLYSMVYQASQSIMEQPKPKYQDWKQVQRQLDAIRADSR